MKCFYASALLVALAPCVVMAAPIISEDFESYTDTADLGTVWSLGTGTLDTGFGNPGQSLTHDGAASVNTLSFSDVVLQPGQKLIYQADIYDDANSSNERNSAGLRGAGSANIIEMGMYNSVLDNHYLYRTVLFAGGATNWQPFQNIVDDSGSPMLNAPVQGWHTFTAEVTTAGTTFILDLNGDGNINATAFVPTVLHANGFNVARLGGPSGVSSSAGGVSFDNVSLSLVPEPSAAILALLIAAPVAASRRR